MSFTIISPRFSFLQFEETGLIQGCHMQDRYACLPVYETNDVWFQFILQAETAEEADALCGLNPEMVTIGLAGDCDSEISVDFTEAGYYPDRYRISPTKVLYNWQHGVPGFDSAFSVRDCFTLKVQVAEQIFCSPCLQRIAENCFTSVIEYGNDENGFGFNYCADSGEDGSGGGSSEVCEPLTIPFTNQATLVIPYTAELLAKYGDVPTVQVWIYDENGDLVDMGVSVKFDNVPPTVLMFDFGGNASGIIKIM